MFFCTRFIRTVLIVVAPATHTHTHREKERERESKREESVCVINRLSTKSCTLIIACMS